MFTLPLLEWIDIPAGRVSLDSQIFEIKLFKIARFPVTNTQFAAFIEDVGYKDPIWWEGLGQVIASPRASDWKEPDSPKLEACWFEAVAFCRWLAFKTDLNLRLPTEWEWQWAAVGDSGWDFPYGSTFDSAKCNTKESDIGRTNIATEYANVKTHFGTVDMAGNVAEWCLNEGDDFRNIGVSGMENRALRGGSWSSTAKNARVSFRSSRTPKTRAFNIGFRVMVGT